MNENEKSYSIGKLFRMVLIVALLLSCISLHSRVNELEERVGTVEDDQTLIVDNMKKTVILMTDIVAKAAKK